MPLPANVLVFVGARAFVLYACAVQPGTAPKTMPLDHDHAIERAQQCKGCGTARAAWQARRRRQRRVALPSAARSVALQAGDAPRCLAVFVARMPRVREDAVYICSIGCAASEVLLGPEHEGVRVCAYQQARKGGVSLPPNWLQPAGGRVSSTTSPSCTLRSGSVWWGSPCSMACLHRHLSSTSLSSLQQCSSRGLANP